MRILGPPRQYDTKCVSCLSLVSVQLLCCFQLQIIIGKYLGACSSQTAYLVECFTWRMEELWICGQS